MVDHHVDLMRTTDVGPLLQPLGQTAGRHLDESGALRNRGAFASRGTRHDRHAVSRVPQVAGLRREHGRDAPCTQRGGGEQDAAHRAIGQIVPRGVELQSRQRGRVEPCRRVDDVVRGCHGVQMRQCRVEDGALAAVDQLRADIADDRQPRRLIGFEEQRRIAVSAGEILYRRTDAVDREDRRDVELRPLHAVDVVPAAATPEVVTIEPVGDGDVSGRESRHEEYQGKVVDPRQRQIVRQQGVGVAKHGRAEQHAPQLSLCRLADGKEAPQDLGPLERHVPGLQPPLVRAARPAVLLHDRDTEAHQVGIRRLRLSVRLVRGIRRQFVVAVQEEHVVGLGGEDPGPAGLERRQVALVSDETNARVADPESLDHGGSAVRRGVVDADHLDLVERLPERALEGVGDRRLVVEDRHDDRDKRRRLHRPRFYAVGALGEASLRDSKPPAGCSRQN